MLLHENTLVSLIFLKKNSFATYLPARGLLCEGDSGAPLELSEIEILKDNIEQIKPFMDEKSIKLLEQKGFYEKDTDGDLVTNCLNGKECIFAITENGYIAVPLKKLTKQAKLISKNQYHAICILSDFKNRRL